MIWRYLLFWTVVVACLLSTHPSRAAAAQPRMCAFALPNNHKVRYRCRVAYDGSRFNGFQYQNNARTIQVCDTRVFYQVTTRQHHALTHPSFQCKTSIGRTGTVLISTIQSHHSCVGCRSNGCWCTCSRTSHSV